MHWSHQNGLFVFITHYTTIIIVGGQPQAAVTTSGIENELLFSDYLRKPQSESGEPFETHSKILLHSLSMSANTTIYYNYIAIICHHPFFFYFGFENGCHK